MTWNTCNCHISLHSCWSHTSLKCSEWFWIFESLVWLTPLPHWALILSQRAQNVDYTWHEYISTYYKICFKGYWINMTHFLVGRTKASLCLSHRSVVWMTVLLAPSPMTTVVVCSLRVTLSELPANSLRSVSGYTNHILSVFCAMTRKWRSQKQYSSCKERRKGEGIRKGSLQLSHFLS